ncbi:GtrA family protein [Marisediminicola sp. LYQ134]|uniref:GtrA family protein n=1 Tax=unclassified Marisediminicola TaxID=2618316 RepID=UPI00398331FE
MHPRLRTLLADERTRFVVIGGVNTVVAYALFLAFEALLDGRYFVSLALSYALATVLAFVLHRRVTFGLTGRSNVILDFVRFESVYVVMFAVNAALLPVFIELAGWPSWLAQATIVVITTIMSYLGHKFFSFRRRPR